MRRVITVLVLCCVLGACSSDHQAATAGESAVAIPAQTLSLGGSLPLLSLGQAELARPDAPAWSGFAEHRIELTLAPPVHQSINLRYDPQTPAVPVHIQAATDGQRIYIRLRWNDASENAATSRQDFADGAAVQFALGGGADTSFMMGAPTGPVNIWYWKAGGNAAQNLAAGGFGSTTALDQAGLGVESNYGDGHWSLVFSRDLAAEGEYMADLSSLPVHLGLALWQGDNSQRDGLKHVTMGWIELVAAQ